MRFRLWMTLSLARNVLYVCRCYGKVDVHGDSFPCPPAAASSLYLLVFMLCSRCKPTVLSVSPGDADLTHLRDGSPRLVVEAIRTLADGLGVYPVLGAARATGVCQWRFRGRGRRSTLQTGYMPPRCLCFFFLL